MKAADWPTADDADAMLQALGKWKVKPSPRQLRLFCVGCCRLVWKLLEAPMQQAVETAERFADGQATDVELAAAHDGEMRRNRSRFDKQGILYGRGDEGPHGRTVAKWAYEATEATTRAGKPVPSKVTMAVRWLGVSAGAPDVGAPALQAAVLRDIVGNPTAPVLLDAAWRSPTAVELAQAIDTDRAFDRLPILADALEDAGCTNRAVLDNCRGSGPHGRGCWVVDLVLGKS